jgi:hypothetical protein
MDKKLFNKIRSLFRALDREIYDNAQGDNGGDVRDRENRYREKLSKLVEAVPPKPRYSKAVRTALAMTLLPESFLERIQEDGQKLASGLTKNKDIQARMKEAKKWMFEDDAPGLRGESQLTVATCAYALHLRGVK